MDSVVGLPSGFFDVGEHDAQAAGGEPENAREECARLRRVRAALAVS